MERGMEEVNASSAIQSALTQLKFQTTTPSSQSAQGSTMECLHQRALKVLHERAHKLPEVPPRMIASEASESFA